MNRNILLGMPTLIELETLQNNIDYCHSLDLDLLEINMNLPYLQVEELKRIHLPEDLKFSIHLPEELNVWDFNPKVRNAYIETIRETIEFADKQNIQIINMHMNRGVYFSLPEKRVYLFEENNPFFNDRNEEFGSMIDDMLQDSEIKIYIENTGILDAPFISRAVESLLKRDSFYLTWDVGHDASSGNKDLHFYKSHIDEIKHVHLHDAIGKTNHLPLGEGELDFPEILSIVDCSIKSIIFETKTVAGLKKSVNYYRKRF